MQEDGTLLICVDYRGINKDTVPIPHIDDLIDTVGRPLSRKSVYYPRTNKKVSLDKDAPTFQRKDCLCM